MLDACVLYSLPLTDLLLRLSSAEFFQVRWSEEIHQEWISNVLINDPNQSRERLERRRNVMNSFYDRAVVGEYQHMIPQILLPDPDDRHVVAASIVGGANVIVTFNLRDFPQSALKPFGITSQHPDPFIAELLAANEREVCSILRNQRLDLKNPPCSADEMLSMFSNIGLKQTVAQLALLPEYL